MKPDRAKQEVPLDLVNDILHVVRSSFYADATDKKWAQDRGFILRRAVSYPAAWLNKRGVTVPPERYREILIGIFLDIKRHGSTGAVKYWPGYLALCVQRHMDHHGEDYYEEGKSLRAALERAQMAFKRAAQAAPAHDPVEGLAQVHRVLAAQHKRKKAAPAPREQMGFPGL